MKKRKKKKEFSAEEMLRLIDEAKSITDLAGMDFTKEQIAKIAAEEVEALLNEEDEDEVVLR